jgi:recombination protein RecT
MKATEKTVADEIMDRVQELVEIGQLDLPDNYSAVNAVKAALLHLQITTQKDGKTLLEAATRKSVLLALFKLVIEGLSVSQDQCAFIVRSGELVYQREYAGQIALAKRFSDFEDVQAQIVYKGDTFEYSFDEFGRAVVDNHIQSIENVGPQNILGAYAVVKRRSGTQTEIMTYDQIKAAWSMNKTGLTSAHTQFPDQMCKKTVISRALKILVRSSDDEAIMNKESRVEQPEANQIAPVEIKAVEAATEIPEPVEQPVEQVKEQPAGKRRPF